MVRVAKRAKDVWWPALAARDFREAASFLCGESSLRFMMRGFLGEVMNPFESTRFEPPGASRGFWSANSE